MDQYIILFFKVPITVHKIKKNVPITLFIKKMTYEKRGDLGHVGPLEVVNEKHIYGLWVKKRVPESTSRVYVRSSKHLRNECYRGEEEP